MIGLMRLDQMSGGIRMGITRYLIKLVTLMILMAFNSRTYRCRCHRQGYTNICKGLLRQPGHSWGENSLLILGLGRSLEGQCLKKVTILHPLNKICYYHNWKVWVKLEHSPSQEDKVASIKFNHLRQLKTNYSIQQIEEIRRPHRPLRWRDHNMQNCQIR